MQRSKEEEKKEEENEYNEKDMYNNFIVALKVKLTDEDNNIYIARNELKEFRD